MFCRYCGAHLLDDSVFCSKCGKNLGRGNPRLERISKTLRLGTPYPYAIFLILLVTIWALSPHAAPYDYANLKWTLEPNRKLDLPNENSFQQEFSLVLENNGSKAVRETPVDLSARIEPAQPADIAATFQGNRMVLMEGGKALSLLTLILSGETHPGSKRNYLIEGSIQAQPPFRVTYEIRAENSEMVLASFTVER
jgi:zinc-ribbon domain